MGIYLYRSYLETDMEGASSHSMWWAFCVVIYKIFYHQMEQEENRSFRLGTSQKKPTAFGNITKKEWWKFKKTTKAEYKNTAILCLLLGIIISPLFLVGVIAGIIYLYKSIAEKKNEKKSL